MAATPAVDFSQFECQRIDCLYRNKAKDPTHACDYCAKTGRVRTKKDKPVDNKNCEYYKPKPAIIRRHGPTPHAPLWDSLARSLYAAGHTDAEIADFCGINVKTAGVWRRKQGLPPHVKAFNSHFDWSKARECYAAGMTDREIAATIGCSHGRVCQWRKENDLPALHGIFGKKLGPTPTENERSAEE